MRNLDRLAARTAQEIVASTKSQVDNLATKSLGVLQENGVYAVTLFLYSRTNKDEKEHIAPAIRKPLLKLAAREIVDPPQSEPDDKAEEALRFVTEQISGDLDTLLLAKQVWEQTLIYVRYGAKAREN